MIDVGVNLTSGQFREDLGAVLERAWDAGLSGMVITGTSETESRAAAALTAEDPHRLWSTAGIHPHHADDCSEAAISSLRELCGRTGVVAVGETGLDFNRNFSTPANQERAFCLQLELARETGLPVFLHEREAFDRQQAILREFRDGLSGGVSHCFTAGRRELFAWLDLDLFVGITGWICDERRGAHLLELVPHIPADRLLIETDAPYLLPRSLSPRPASRRNEPCYLPEVVRVLAEARQESMESVISCTTENACRLFRIQLAPDAAEREN